MSKTSLFMMGACVGILGGSVKLMMDRDRGIEATQGESTRQTARPDLVTPLPQANLVAYRQGLGVALAQCQQANPDFMCPGLIGAMKASLRVSEKHATCTMASILYACLTETPWPGWTQADDCGLLLSLLEVQRLANPVRRGH